MSRSSARVYRFIWSVVLIVVAVLCSGTLGQPPAPVSKRDADNNGSSDGHRVHFDQIDLFSGTPTFLIAIAAFIQILPLPIFVFKPRLARFLDWLRANVERDFGISICTCNGQCLGCKYQPTEYWVRRWLNISLDKEEPIECGSPEVLNAVDLEKIIRRGGNGDVFLRLAQLTCYPQMHELTIGVRAIQYSPPWGRKVVAIQWLGLFFAYIYHLLFYNELVDMIQATYRFLNTVYQRIFLSLPPSDRHGPTCISLGYRISDLARHRILRSHLHWVRYGVYGMLIKVAGKTISLEFRKKSLIRCVHDKDTVKFSIQTDHPSQDDSSIAQDIAADECSAAQLLYSIAFHSVRVMLLCSELGFAPPHFITGSFRTIYLTSHDYVIHMNHPTLADTYRTLYNPNNNLDVFFIANCSLLLKLLQPPLGSLLVDEWLMPVKLSLRLRRLPDSAYLLLRNTRDSGSSTNSDCDQEMYFCVDGFQVEPSDVTHLVRTQYRILNDIHKTLTYPGPQSHRWGPRAWVLFSLLESLYGLISESTPMDDNPAKTLHSLQYWTRLICMSHFQPVFGVLKKDLADPQTLIAGSFQEGWRKVSTSWFDATGNYIRSPPAWCICPTHCRGLCSVLVDRFHMTIDADCYNQISCAFYREDCNEKSGIRRDLKLVCANYWDVIHYECIDQTSNQGLQQSVNPHPMNRFDATEFKLGAALYANTTRPAAIVKDIIFRNCTIMVNTPNAEPSTPGLQYSDSANPLVYQLCPVRKELGHNSSGNHVLQGGITGMSTGRLAFHATLVAKFPGWHKRPFRNK